MAEQGTRKLFGQWLSAKKGMTYTKYTHLSPAEKEKIQKEYRERKAPSALPIVSA